MDLRQLKQFQVLAEELNFRRAAERLNMTQPPLSAAIKRLEEIVGVQLLQRSRTHVSLTAAGAAFLRETQHLLSHVELSIDIAQATAKGTNGILRIASIASAAFKLLPSLLGDFRAVCPNVRLVLSSSSSHGSAIALQNGTIDLALIVPATSKIEGLDIRIIRNEMFCLAVSKQHKLARQSCVQLSEIQKDILVALYPFEASLGYSAAMLAAFHQAHVYPSVNQPDTDLLTKLALVSAGVGVALIPKPMCNIMVENVSFIDVVSVEGTSLTYDIAVARREENDAPAVLQLWELALTGSR
jgi:DNA-binding transcriptional LysR family regulator